MTFTLIHFFSVFSLVLYVLAFIFLYLPSRKNISNLLLLIGIVMHFFSLSVLVSTEYRIHESVSTIDSSPSLLLIVCSFVIFILFYLTHERSKLFSASFIGIGILLFTFGGIYLHSGTGSFTYEISTILLVHILFSVLSQVSVFFVLIIGFLIQILHRNLKKRRLGSLGLPNLSSLEKMLASSLQGVIVFLVISLVSGVMQKELLDKHMVKLLFSLGYFITFVSALFVMQMKKLAVPVLSFYLFASTLVLLLGQFFYRLI